MIYVSCGHLKGIGLEIFLKSFLLLSNEDQKLICLVINNKSFKQYFSDYKFNFSLYKNLNTITLESEDVPESTQSLLECIKNISPGDILITLPTSKDQLVYNNINCPGYTEFFRKYFNNENISMFFKSYRENVLLISDHIPLSNVSTYINSEIINLKILTALSGFNKYFSIFDGFIEEIIVSGINPHAGENGILGTEEKFLQLYSANSIKVIGPLPGDTLHVHKNDSINQLFVYMYHDQALASFKARNLFTGLNITFGLPFLRLSVDHGTAFNLYAKNKASLTGMMYLLKTAIEVHRYGNK